MYDFEKGALFSRNWQYVVHEDQLNAVGDVIHAKIAGNPILLIKTKHGAVNGFNNVCKHRGLQSNTYNKGFFSVKRQFGVYHVQSLIKNLLNKLFIKKSFYFFISRLKKVSFIINTIN